MPFEGGDDLRSCVRQQVPIRCWALFFVLLGLTLWVGCSSTQNTRLPASLREGINTRTLTPTAPQTVVVTQTTPAPFNPTMPLTLTLWLPPDMAESAQQSGHALYKMNQAFLAANPQVRLEIITKAPYGLGGMVNMLLTTRAVVPKRLPDIFVFDVSELHLLVDKDILVPLDESVPSALWDDLFPFAPESVTSQGRRMAVPFQTDILFLAYNEALTSKPPRVWSEFAANRSDYIFPAGQGDGSAADIFLLQYFAAGGSLSQDGIRPYLDTAVMSRVLRMYRSAFEAGAINKNVRNLKTLDDCWAIYLAGDASMTNVSSWQYQRDRAMLQRTRFTQIPTSTGEPLTLAHSWAWGMVNQDAQRRAVAAQYITFALRAEHLAAWCVVSFHLPTLRLALPLAIDDQSYRAFIEDQLWHARPYPNVSQYFQVQEAIIRAIEDVLDGIATPERAALVAASTVARLR